ncbi:5'-phosphate synthase pdxT subunit [Hypnocyclicus thermotrophus]|uniref:Pyridoxal 5'-phosphate synthase subunit PdxT n=1 Tax=Hypnocyclicus thermotrophus TaxID=1627895 RepID=A0AA46I5R0_9FUSO|nr:pyridoxal 5'-phosphate synthase glutaminase subunit PdxT [Hypnocyclicus thermotrophus]TDT70568.1 5'-phosphate synthase pdxT subunit [Hypnocyclicus thermotrophus]
MKIGVLALQGAFIEHINILRNLNVEAIEIRKKEKLNEIDGLIIPGGESTAIGKLLVDLNIKDSLIEKIKEGLPIFGTCAGLILLAKKIVNDDKIHLGVMDIVVRRNAYGRQLGSFYTEEYVKNIGEKIKMTFIRAPYIEAVENNVEVLSQVNGHIVAAKQNNILVTSFHPELTDDNRVHKYFIKIVKENKK